MKINMPPYVTFILDRLEKGGFQAYIVGGSIRDILLDKEPNDFDITTNAMPDYIEKIFEDKKTINVGREFGTIKVIVDDKEVEVTTFRKEGNYSDGRRPEWIEFVSDIEDDLARRDFTINAMAYNKKTGIVDPFNGKKDLENKIIRSVGNPIERFKEDYLRILRAVRFSTSLDFEIEDETFKAGKKYSSNISKVSVERITEEFFKIILSPKPSKGINYMKELDLLDIVLPEIVPAIGFNQQNPHHDKDVYNHILCVVDSAPPILKIRLAALFHDMGKPHTLSVDEKGIGHFYGHDKIGSEIAKKALKRMKAPGKLTEQVAILIREHMTHHAKFKEKGLKRLIRRVGIENIYDLFELQKADRKCSNKNASIEHILDMEKKVDNILEKKEVYEINQLNIDGEDLIEIGFKEGKIIGDILEYLLEKVMENPSINKREELEKLALKKYATKPYI
ncbi:CCA tRNA nucleotidyltransferase [Anaerosalibacter massiliensis]|uniref:CCA tRNA nucleotidyltransferase n=1 Tax=Anaerosalibacter massiliensis TaxID=1347392 RepID=A0A9X2MG03_9FIRM|nr:CCA tRNA nucleotidyltransferase [Anaerosalibacter massiliensis]MCR2043310.1 CCA tRNA nucleotidyltransferase [Anaerosalibacter massiliensis]